MLNYIWAGLIVFSLVFAVANDVQDARHDPYRNGKALAISVRFPKGYDPAATKQDAEVTIDGAAYERHYGVAGKLAAAYPGAVERVGEKWQFRFAKDAALPAPLNVIRDNTSPSDDKQLRGLVNGLGDLTPAATGPAGALATITFDSVRMVKINALAGASVDSAKNAVTIALGLIGTLALWQGLLRIADKAGLVNILVRITEPVLRPLFPDIPKDSPALGLIALNLSANMLGLGNAATPIGLKAMEELQKLNPKKDTATNAMVMLLALHTSALQLVPPALLFAVMGVAANVVYFPILIMTFLTAIVAILFTKFLSRLPGYRASDPQLAGAEPATNSEGN